ncbi:MAG: coA-transferase family protein [Herminiimonas sp.]|nr:coA-transferase family protein [Herminiimonas sp.]MDB5853665.1 coA-transferase family protein [Herminiimonas sp.]
MQNGTVFAPGSLAGVRILDLSRILAGPSCTQLLADLGADVIKVEKPDAGDDTRKWGPPYLCDQEGRELAESAYYACANRNKRSIAADLSTAAGREIIHQLLACSDVLVENFKVGDLARHGLAYEQLKERYPGLVYCSITGFGQDGPYAERPGYDFLAQGMGGIMSLNGDPVGEPQKVAVGITDLMTGMYAAVGILAALRHRDRSAEGQLVDVALLDTQVAWLANAGVHYLTSGQPPARLGNGHPNIVPYEVFPALDGFFILAIGNDDQFKRFCALARVPNLADDPRYTTNRARVENRRALIPELKAVTARESRAFWLEQLQKERIPGGPINTIPEVFADPQVLHRGMLVDIPAPGLAAGKVSVIGNPIHMSRTAPTYRRPPPTLGQHTTEVLRELAAQHSKIPTI